MWKILVFLVVNLLFCIFTYIYLFIVYKDSEKDPSKIQFGFGEKENFFKTMDKTPGLQFDNDCYYYQDLIMEPKIQKLEDFFEFNIESIHKGSIILLFFLFYFILILSLISLNIFLFGLSFIFPSFLKAIPIVFMLINIFSRFDRCLGCINLIAFIHIIHAYYSSDINSYYDFLSCDNINIAGFKKYKSIENLKYDFPRFMVLNIVCMAFSIIYVPIILSMEREN